MKGPCEGDIKPPGFLIYVVSFACICREGRGRELTSVSSNKVHGEERDSYEDLGIEERTIFKRILKVYL